MGGWFSKTEENVEQFDSDSREGMPGYCENQNSLCPKKLRKPLVTILKEILKTKIKLDGREESENNSILKEFLETFIDEMKASDKVFALIYQTLYYTGSYYCDLRISQPNEFDINLVLKLPFKPCELEVENQSQVPSYVKYRLKNIDKEVEKQHAQILKLFFENGYLIPEKVRSWIQSVVDKAKRNYRPPAGCIDIAFSASGPARTIVLKKIHGIIDIDLVPVIQGVVQAKSIGIDGRICKAYGNSLECFLVPKPFLINSSNMDEVSSLECSRLWRTHFPNIENKLIHDLGCVKPIIKLLKLLRDTEDWKVLASYYLKTILLWMILNNPDKEYWKEDKMGERFIEVLEKLQQYVLEKKIPYFFNARYNLLKIKPDHSSNLYYRLSSIIKSIKDDPQLLWGIFKCPRTFPIIS